MPTLRSSLTAAVVAAAVVVLGCGSAATNRHPPLTAAQYKTRANAICRAASKKAIPFPGKRSGKGLVTTANLITPYLEKTLKIERYALSQLKNLLPPPAQETSVRALIDAQEARVLDLQQALDAAKARDASGFQTAFQNDQKQDGPRYARAAEKLGLRDCTGSL